MKKKTDKQTPPEEVEAAEEGRAEESATTETTPAAESPEEQRDRLQDQLRRAMADLQNFRKRQFKEMEDARRRALEGLTAELLPVLDNFELALAAHAQHDSPQHVSDAAQVEGAMVEGVRMVRSLLQGVLERHGLAEVPALGKPFDPNVHEAVGMDPQAEVEAGHVSKVMQQGYSMGERIIRPAKVLVAGASQAGGPAEEQEGVQPDDGRDS